MLNLLKTYEKEVKINGNVYANGLIGYSAYQLYDGEVTVELNFKQEEREEVLEYPPKSEVVLICT